MIINFDYNNKVYSLQTHVDRAAGITLYNVTDNYAVCWSLSSFIIAQNFSVTPPSKTSGTKQNTVTIPAKYRLFVTHPVGDYITGDADVMVTDKNLTLSGTTVTIGYYINNPKSKTSNFVYCGTILLIRTVV